MKNMKVYNLLVGFFCIIVLIVIGNYISINKRVSIVETQVNNDHEMIIRYSENVKNVNAQLTDIKGRIIYMQSTITNKK